MLQESVGVLGWNSD